MHELQGPTRIPYVSVADIQNILEELFRCFESSNFLSLHDLDFKCVN